jgi:putative ABC transport system permease protein
VLAIENAARSPKRTSATASALLIGVALVGFITVFAASARQSVVAEVERGFTGDLIVQGEASGFGPPGGFPPSVADTIASIEGVETVSRIGFTQAQVTYPDGRTATQFVQSIDPTTLSDVFDARMAEGEVADLSPGGALVDQGVASDNGLAVGDVVRFTGTGGQTVELEIQALSDDLTVLGFWSIDTADYDRLVSERQLVQVIATLEVGMTRSQLRSAIRWEAVLISVLGTVVGLGLGLVVSWALVTSLGSFGLTRFSVPVGQLVVVVLVAAVLGVLASIRPARRAAKLDVLDAIATE